MIAHVSALPAGKTTQLGRERLRVLSSIRRMKAVTSSAGAVSWPANHSAATSGQHADDLLCCKPS